MLNEVGKRPDYIGPQDMAESEFDSRNSEKPLKGLNKKVT